MTYKRRTAIVGLLVAILLLVTACGGTSATETPAPTEAATETPATEAPKDTGAAATEAPAATEEPIVYSQSPYLDGKDLPKVEDRLPKVPKVVNETDASQLTLEIGKYGGNLRFASNQLEFNPDMFIACDEALINTPGLLGTEFTGNIVESFEMSDDQKEFTFKMREGLKWSDGTPVTMEDIMFTYNSVLLNKELTAAMPAKYCSGGLASGTPMVLEQVDEWTFKIKFDQPYGAFLVRIAIQGWVGYTDLLKPAHYLKQYHIDFAEDAAKLDAMTVENGFVSGEWFNLFNLKDVTNWFLTYEKAVGFPNLQPWMVVTMDTQTATFERNPYYFKVDAEGQQLPYIDQLTNYMVADVEILNTKILAGELDYVRESAGLTKLPLYKENESRGGYTTAILPTHGRPGNVMLSLTNEDATWQSAISQLKFRQALSMAIDRQDIIDTVYYGQGEIPTKYADYPKQDKAGAEALLEEIGMTVGANGKRIAPDGKPFALPMEVSTRVPESLPQAEQLVPMWTELGIDASLKTIDNALLGQRRDANEMFGTVERLEDYWWQAGVGDAWCAPTWLQWHNTKGEKGTEPPAEYKELLVLKDTILGQEPEAGYAAYKKALDVIKENVFIMVVLENPKQPLIVNSKLGNIPHDGTTMNSNFSIEQFFFKN